MNNLYNFGVNTKNIKEYLCKQLIKGGNGIINT